MQVEDCAFEEQRVNQERKLTRWGLGIESRQAEIRSKFVDFCQSALPGHKLRNGTANRKFQRLLRIAFMCSHASYRSCAGKNTRCQLFKECLALAFAGTAERVAHFLRPY